jgi:hypothetical protein
MIMLQSKLSGNELPLQKICLSVSAFDNAGIAFGTTHTKGTHRVGMFYDALLSFLTKKQLTDTLTDEQIMDMATYMYNYYIAMVMMYSHFYFDAYAPEMITSDANSNNAFTRATARKFYNRIERLPAPLWVLSLARELVKPFVMVDYDAQPILVFPFGAANSVNLDAILDKLENGKKSSSFLRTYGVNMVQVMRSRDFDTSKHHESVAVQNLIDPDKMAFWFASYPGTVQDSTSGDFFPSKNDFSYDDTFDANRKYLIFENAPHSFFTIPGLTVADAPIQEKWNVGTAYESVLGAGTGFDSMFGVTLTVASASEGPAGCYYKDAAASNWTAVNVVALAEAEAWVLWFVGLAADDTGTIFDGQASWDAAGITDPGMHQGVLPFYTFETVELPSSFDQEDKRDSTVLYIEHVLGGGGNV